MKERYFFSTPRAAHFLGVSVRTIGRLSVDHDLDPLVFEGSGRIRHYWTRPILLQMQKCLKSMKGKL